MSVVPLGDERVSTGPLTVLEDGTVVVPAEVLRAAGICPGSSVGFTIREDGEVVVAERDPDQAWFWTEEWLAGTHQAKLELREGKSTVYLTDDEFLAELERLHKLA
jgi:bifunctional DNA-binding transcriptional regulator/antitoxin component of YhaV-PrlF toxin-antitoxin module